MAWFEHGGPSPKGQLPICSVWGCLCPVAVGWRSAAGSAGSAAGRCVRGLRGYRLWLHVGFRSLFLRQLLFVISRHPSASRDPYKELSSLGSSLPDVCHHALFPCFSFEDLLCPFLLYLLVFFHPRRFLSIGAVCASANPFLRHFLLCISWVPHATSAPLCVESPNN